MSETATSVEAPCRPKRLVRIGVASKQYGRSVNCIRTWAKQIPQLRVKFGAQSDIDLDVLDRIARGEISIK